MKAGERHRFAVLDGWRGVCAVLVALYHLPVATSVFPLPLVRHAWLFVDFFFVLSGFVISYAYADRLTTLRDGIGFAIRRFGRMWPLHAATLMMLIALESAKLAAAHVGHIAFARAPFGPDALSTPAAIPTNLLMIQALGLHDGGTWNMPAWSVSVEFWTNLLFAGLVLALRRTALASAGLAALGALVVWRFADMGTTSDFGLFRCLFGFFVGALARDVWLVLRARGFRSPPWLEVVVLALVVAYVWVPLPNDALLAAPFVFASAVLAFAFEAGPVSRLMRAGAVRRLGEWSYSVYMVHWVVLQAAGGLLRLAEAATRRTFRIPYADAPPGLDLSLIDFGTRWGNDLYGLAYLAAVIGLAALTFAWIEEPARRAFNRRARAIERAAPAPAGMAER